MPGKSTIRTDTIVAKIKEELTDLYKEGILSAGAYERKKTDRLIIDGINQADRDICLHEKYENTVALYCPSDRATIYFDEQSNYWKNFIDEHSSIKTTDKIQFAYLTKDDAFLDIISVASTKGFIYDSIPLKGENSTDRIEHAMWTDMHEPNLDRGNWNQELAAGDAEAYKHYFHVMPSQKKMLLSKPFSSDKWILFKAKVAPGELDILNMSKSRLDSYDIITPYYCKAWLVLKALSYLLPMRAMAEAGLLDEETSEMQRVRRKKPGRPTIVHSGDEYTSAYELEFDNL